MSRFGSVHPHNTVQPGGYLLLPMEWQLSPTQSRKQSVAALRKAPSTSWERRGRAEFQEDFWSSFKPKNITSDGALGHVGCWAGCSDVKRMGFGSRVPRFVSTDARGAYDCADLNWLGLT